MNSPSLRFDFLDATRFYHHPAEVVEAHTVAEVLPALAAVENAVARGLHAAGYLAYEAAPAFDAAMETHPSGDMPLLWFGLFDAPTAPPPIHPAESFALSDWLAGIEEGDYNRDIGHIHDAIAAGETYQVNYSMRLRASMEGADAALYHRLRRAQGSGYHARLDMGRFRILSASPELFFRWDGSLISTRPMKGTMRRGRSSREDEDLKAALRLSEKDRAENVMITDMMRSDIGRIAVPGSVSVEGLFNVETYPTLHQMTSTVSARTRAGVRLTDVFSALFPSASVTGAPKVNTMRWIRRLEREPRGVYCGAIGYIQPGGEAVFNVPIRTMIVDTVVNRAEYSVGGGVTWDSTRKGEYAEAWLKAQVLTQEMPIFDLLETLLLRNGRYRLKSRHLDRLAASARYFGFPCTRAQAGDALDRFAEANPAGEWRVRLLLGPDGSIRVEGAPPGERSNSRQFSISSQPVDSSDPLLHHKTTWRRVYDDRRAGYEDVFDVLLANERGEITEFTTGNVALDLEGVRYTPPVESGLLAGTFREYLLASGEMVERVITRQDLKRATRVWYINSVRGWVELKQKEEQASTH